MFFFGNKRPLSLKEMEDVYAVSLLFSKKVELPDDETIKRELGTVFQRVVSENHGKKEEYRIFGILDYEKEVEGIGKVPAHLAMEKELTPFLIRKKEEEEMRIQPDCEEAEEILKKAKYELCLSDFLSIDLLPRQRGHLITSWVKLMAFTCQDCIGVYNHRSKKIMSRNQVVALFSKDDTESFLEFGVKLRLYPIGGRDEILIDTFGLYGIDLVDLQYHLRRVDPTNFFEHAKSMAMLLYENEVELEEGDAVTGIARGDRWFCHYERSIASPSRRVIDVDTGSYAARR